MTIGRRDGRAARRDRRAALSWPPRLFLAGLLLATSCWSGTGPSAADGPSTGLTLQVTVNTRPGLGALRPGIRTGAAVVKTYRLTNRGDADLYGLWVRDPGMPGVRVRCPGGRDRVPMLVGYRTVTCTAAGVARPGLWVGEAVATGRQPHLRAVVRAAARSGYAGVGGALALRETARVTGPRQARVRYVLTNTGNRPVHAVRVTDPALAPDRVVCAGGRPVVARLAPGATAACAAVVRRAPGTYVSHGRAEGSDLLRTLGTRGGPVAPPRLTARATARFTLRAPAVPTARPPVRPPVRPSGRPPGVPPLPVPFMPVPALPVPALPVVPVPVPPLPVPPVVGLPLPPPGAAVPGLPEAAVQPFAPVLPPWVAPPQVPPYPPKPQQREQARQKEREREQPQQSFLGRFSRGIHGLTGLGLSTVLFLVLLPAAVAAAVLGARRR